MKVRFDHSVIVDFETNKSREETAMVLSRLVSGINALSNQVIDEYLIEGDYEVRVVENPEQFIELLESLTDE